MTASTSPLIEELDRFFSENGDILEYFAPEAAEHLDELERAAQRFEAKLARASGPRIAGVG